MGGEKKRFDPANLPRVPPFVGTTTDEDCLSLVGMAGAGKSTLGRLVAERLGFAHLDTDRLIEATFGMPLQALLDARGLDEFLRLEEDVVSRLWLRRCVVSTGGSVVYGRRAVERLRRCGPVVFLEIDLSTFLARVGKAQDRGFARPGGKSLEEVFAERQPLYAAAADYRAQTGKMSPGRSAADIVRWMRARPAGDAKATI
ncbi:homoserine kinase [Desulfolutivibrio sulfoxidireducens]|uniref:homoserine kinase n=1 Tax=Desulfolutivibrio sulfoxidireducens TaxID=2773299 RepID=UPI00159EA692|nr:homoserine kinase [Desulfolutivibrio sulfoxidireducens]QLA21698.1 AAA family ATPase [Desulfolutivibrio sulfoxidireducens]